MKQIKFIHPILFYLFVLAGLSSCAVNPRCPTQLMPIIEVQIGNTASTHDDYIGTGSFTACRARIINFEKNSTTLNFQGGVEVEVRNRRLSSDLIVSSTSSGTTPFFFTTLLGNGGWFNFFIRGTTNSSVDKSAILEIATAAVSCNEVVLTRKGLMVTASPPIPAGRPQVEIEVGTISHLDDYVNWTPKFCRIKWINPSSATSSLNVTLRNLSPSDRLRFASTQPAAGTTATATTTSLTLSGDQSWVSFYIAGNNGNASVNDKDAIFEVINAASSQLLAREGVMVRIRKNVNSLTTNERDRYLEAIREVHQTYNFYMLFRNSHSQDDIADLQAHEGSAFLPWHRAFVLHFERLVQSSDPSVAIPYWHFDQSSPNMFNGDFIGSNPTGLSNNVTLNTSNPIITWSIGSTMGIIRRTPYGDLGTPGSVMATPLTPIETELATLALGIPGNTYRNFKRIEGRTHNGAHNNSGNTVSWIAGDRAIAPNDPLFYFLHCNIDRLWAKWQWEANRFDGTQVTTYDMQGSFTTPTVAGQRRGQYVDDTLWPWDNITGGTGLAERPTTAPLTPFPTTIGNFFPFGNPTIKNLIDFKLLDFAYDDVYPY